METTYFPSVLRHDQQSQGVIKFDVFSWEIRGKQQYSKGKFSDPKHTKSNIATIVLPIPSTGLSESYNINWEATETVGAKSLKEAFGKAIIGKIKDTLGDPAKYIEYQQGAIVNDFSSQAFGGTEFREFTFTFKMVPSSMDEANDIIKIMNTFKKYSLSNWNKQFIDYPHFWNIGTLFPGTDFDGVRFKNCVCTSIECNYFPDSIITLYRTGHPIAPELTVSFKELDKVYADDIEI